MWRSTLVTAMVLLCSVPAQASQSCQRIVQVGAWNIQWLGNAKEGKRQAQAPEDLASYIAASKVEILALSEISATGKDSAGRFRNQTLDDALALLNDQGARWDYEIFEKRPGDSSRIRPMDRRGLERRLGHKDRRAMEAAGAGR